jgi:hypothetical protein
MCISHSLYEAIELVSFVLLFGWMWWVVFNAGTK